MGHSLDYGASQGSEALFRHLHGKTEFAEMWMGSKCSTTELLFPREAARPLGRPMWLPRTSSWFRGSGRKWTFSCHPLPPLPIGSPMWRGDGSNNGWNGNAYLPTLLLPSPSMPPCMNETAATNHRLHPDWANCDLHTSQFSHKLQFVTSCNPEVLFVICQ